VVNIFLPHTLIVLLHQMLACAYLASGEGRMCVQPTPQTGRDAYLGRRLMTCKIVATPRIGETDTTVFAFFGAEYVGNEKVHFDIHGGVRITLDFSPWLRADRDGRQHAVALEPGLIDRLVQYEARLREKYAGAGGGYTQDYSAPHPVPDPSAGTLDDDLCF
jgi:hypothetical protein